ncbi:MAG: hypothetical protein ACF8LK_06270 [Phycisphaerales bacterium JB041]
MSELVCYIDRAERGMLPVRLRLVSTRVDQSWEFPAVVSDDRAALQRGLRDAANWIAEQLKAQNRSGLGALVLDTDGARSGWVGTLSSEPDTVGAALRQASAPASTDDDGTGLIESPPHVAITPDMQIDGAVSVQPLDAATGRAAHPQPHGTKRRVGVAVIPDATIRLLLDLLDERGIAVGRVVSIWHVLSEAFGDVASSGSDRMVSAGTDGTLAYALVDPTAGRMVWVWSRGGAPIASGAFRLARGVPAGHDASAFVLSASDLSRLAGEWLAWSTQLGASPSRFRLVLPDWVWNDGSSLGERVSGVWPGATADIAMENDPIALALSSFADGLGDPGPTADRPSLEQLQTRPGRPHRAMYRWAAAAVAIAAVGMGGAAYRVHASAKAADAKAADARRVWREKIGELQPADNEGAYAGEAYDALAVENLRTALETQRRAVAPIAITPPKPVLRELETLSYVLGNPDYELRRVSISDFAVTIVVIVPDTAAYEELTNSLQRIAGSEVAEWSQSPKPQGDGIQVTLNGTWISQGRTQPGGA